MIGYIILGIVVLFVLILVIRTLTFKPVMSQLPEKDVLEDYEYSDDQVIEHLAEMIRCKTVSDRDESKMDWAEFEKFQNLLPKLYPLIHERFTLEKIGKSGLLYHMKGKKPGAPIVLMAHYDVVPVDESQWTKPAFDGIIEDGVLWGRGTLDTKGSLCGVMEAVENLLHHDFVPTYDLYLSFAGDEEVDGTSCPEIVKTFESRGIIPRLVLDEGGAIVEGAFPGVSVPCAMIGTAEKGGLCVDMEINSPGGHSSTPPKKTALGRLSRAVTRLEKNPMKCHMTQPVAEMLDTLGRHSSFGLKLLFANLWCFKGLFFVVCKLLGGELNAMVTTTLAVTKMQGSDAYNVLPPKAKAGANLRLLEGDTVEKAIEHINKVMDDKDIKVSFVSGGNASRTSRTDCCEFALITQSIRQTWEGVVPSPYLMMACSDSRHYSRISDRVYRFSPMTMTSAERKMIHGHDERVEESNIKNTVAFFMRLLLQLDQLTEE